MDAASILLVLATLGVSDGSSQSTDRPTATANVQQTARDAGAVHHTAFFAGQGGWVSDASTAPPPAAAPQYDRYGTPIHTAGATSPPPGVIDRTRAAVVESGDALRDGVEAGFQAADRQLTQGTEQFVDSTRNAAQDVSSQFQGWAGTASQQSQTAATNAFTPPATPNTRGPVTNPFAPAATATTGNTSTTRTRNGIQPPPWATGQNVTADDANWPTMTTTATPAATVPFSSPPLASPRTAALPPVIISQTPGGGWTTVNANSPAPPMLIPRLVNTPTEVQPIVIDTPDSSPLQQLVTNSGPGFPNSNNSGPPTDHSVLAQTQPSTRPPAAVETSEDFSIGWDRNTASPQQATIGGGGRYDSTPPAPRQDQPVAGNASQATVRAPSQQSPDDRTSQFDQWAKDDLWRNEAKSQQGNMPPGTQAAATQPGTNAAPQPNTGVAPPPATTATIGQPATAVPASTDKPWMTLVFVTAGLAGSIGANFFLGWSYMDARQKYRHLVQKTASKFRRAASAA